MKTIKTNKTKHATRKPKATKPEPWRDPKHPANPANMNLCLGMPAGTADCHAIQRDCLMQATARSYRCGISTGMSSALTMNFNELYCRAINGGFTHFLLWHSDILPHGPFVDTLLDVMYDHNLEVISALAPIKDNHGLTSSGFDTDKWRPRRVTMTEAMKLPAVVTNDAKDIERCRALLGDPMGPLLINTGLLLIDLSAPWVESLCFSVRNRIVRVTDDDGNASLMPEFEPEDWLMSRDLNRWGARYGWVDGRILRIGHVGNLIVENNRAWGTMPSDTYNSPQAGRCADVVSGYNGDGEEVLDWSDVNATTTPECETANA